VSSSSASGKSRDLWLLPFTSPCRTKYIKSSHLVRWVLRLREWLEPSDTVDQMLAVGLEEVCWVALVFQGRKSLVVLTLGSPDSLISSEMSLPLSVNRRRGTAELNRIANPEADWGARMAIIAQEEVGLRGVINRRIQTGFYNWYEASSHC
jgi:hypothetical protein